MSDFNNNISNSGGPGSSAEPSMEEILASIRRILKEDEAAQPAQVDIDDDVLVLDESMLAKPADFTTATELPPAETLSPIAPEPRQDSYNDNFNGNFNDNYTEPARFNAEPAYFVQDLPPPPAEPAFVQPAEPAFIQPAAPVFSQQEEPAPEPIAYTPSFNPEPEPTMPETVEPPHGLLSEDATNAAATSIGALVRSISSDRSVAISRGGITIEDIVRDEIRPLVKAWLDTHLPSLVERLVRSEIERVIDRAAS
jgi:cell pole-organizing protein PopZ